MTNKKKAGRPARQQNIPRITLGINRTLFIYQGLLEHGKVFIPELGVLEIRKFKRKLMDHNLAKRRLIIKGGYKLHITAGEQAKEFIKRSIQP